MVLFTQFSHWAYESTAQFFSLSQQEGNHFFPSRSDPISVDGSGLGYISLHDCQAARRFISLRFQWVANSIVKSPVGGRSKFDQLFLGKIYTISTCYGNSGTIIERISRRNRERAIVRVACQRSQSLNFLRRGFWVCAAKHRMSGRRSLAVR